MDAHHAERLPVARFRRQAPTLPPVNGIPLHLSDSGERPQGPPHRPRSPARIGDCVTQRNPGMALGTEHASELQGPSPRGARPGKEVRRTGCSGGVQAPPRARCRLPAECPSCAFDRAPTHDESQIVASRREARAAVFRTRRCAALFRRHFAPAAHCAAGSLITPSPSPPLSARPPRGAGSPDGIARPYPRPLLAYGAR